MLLFLVEPYTIKMNIIKSYNITHKYVYPPDIVGLNNIHFDCIMFH